jgi:iron complex outermembrane receptor protein
MKGRGYSRAYAVLCLGALAALVGAGDAFAADESSEQLQEIVVTGSRVRGEAPVGATVTTIGREDIATSSQVTVDRLIEQVPQVFDLGVSENSRAQAGGAGNIVYANSVNLRGIGANATLTLVDGHRVTSNTRTVTPSVIPSLGLERVEIIADGASAIYGSDAIAGVVNLIPRRNLDGGEVMGHYGASPDGAFHEWQTGFALGKVWERGQVMVAYEHVFRSNLNGDDRSFFVGDQTAFGGKDYRITSCSPGTISAGGVTYAIPAGGVTQATAGSLVAGTANRCNSIIGQDLFPEQKYDSLNSTFTQTITDWLSFFADGFYSKRSFARHAASTTTTLNVPSTNAFFVTPPGFTGTSYTIGYNFIDDLPNNTSSGYARSWEVSPGLRFKLPYDWQFEALVTYGRTHDEANSYNATNNAALNAALASSDPATAFDPYGLHRTAANVLALLSNQIFLAPTIGRFTGYEARFNGKLIELPGGTAKLAAGYERQNIGVDLGLARGNPGTPMVYRTFSRRVDSVYGELLVPLVGNPNAMRALRRLDFDAAVRYDKYDDVGSTTNPKFGLNWSPADGLTFRGSYGKSFRAPQIAEIYGNSNAIYQQNYQNPAGGPQVPGSAYSGPNLNLKPETATTWSVGADWEPLHNLRFSLTRFNVDYKNQVNAYLSDLTILTRANLFAGTGLILTGTAARDRVLQLLAQGVGTVGPFPGGDPNNVTIFVDGRNQNLGRSITTGYDFQGMYRMDTARNGAFILDVNGTYISRFETAITAAAPLVDNLNKIFNPLRFKARASVTWDRQPLQLKLTLNDVGSYTNTAVKPNERVRSYTPVDFALSWSLGDPQGHGLLDGIMLGLTVDNLFDTDPPYVNLAPNVNGSGGYDATAANPIGRVFGLSIRKKW